MRLDPTIRTMVVKKQPKFLKKPARNADCEVCRHDGKEANARNAMRKPGDKAGCQATATTCRPDRARDRVGPGLLRTSGECNHSMRQIGPVTTRILGDSVQRGDGRCVPPSAALGEPMGRTRAQRTSLSMPSGCRLDWLRLSGCLTSGCASPGQLSWSRVKVSPGCYAPENV